MEDLEYTVVLEYNRDGTGYTAIVPALPGCMSHGETRDEALDNAQNAIALWISVAKKRGEPIPPDKDRASQNMFG